MLEELAPPYVAERLARATDVVLGRWGAWVERGHAIVLREMVATCSCCVQRVGSGALVGDACTPFQCLQLDRPCPSTPTLTHSWDSDLPSFEGVAGGGASGGGPNRSTAAAGAPAAGRAVAAAAPHLVEVSTRLLPSATPATVAAVSARSRGSNGGAGAAGLATVAAADGGGAMCGDGATATSAPPLAAVRAQGLPALAQSVAAAGGCVGPVHGVGLAALHATAAAGCYPHLGGIALTGSLPPGIAPTAAAAAGASALNGRLLDSGPVVDGASVSFLVRSGDANDAAIEVALDPGRQTFGVAGRQRRDALLRARLEHLPRAAVVVFVGAGGAPEQFASPAVARSAAGWGRLQSAFEELPADARAPTLAVADTLAAVGAQVLALPLADHDGVPRLGQAAAAAVIAVARAAAACTQQQEEQQQQHRRQQQQQQQLERLVAARTPALQWEWLAEALDAPGAAEAAASAAASLFADWLPGQRSWLGALLEGARDVVLLRDVRVPVVCAGWDVHTLPPRNDAGTLLIAFAPGAQGDALMTIAGSALQAALDSNLTCGARVQWLVELPGRVFHRGGVQLAGVQRQLGAPVLRDEQLQAVAVAACGTRRARAADVSEVSDLDLPSGWMALTERPLDELRWRLTKLLPRKLAVAGLGDGPGLRQLPVEGVSVFGARSWQELAQRTGGLASGPMAGSATAVFVHELTRGPPAARALGVRDVVADALGWAAPEGAVVAPLMAAGLANPGVNCCYINATLQALRSCQPFMSRFAQLGGGGGGAGGGGGGAGGGGGGARGGGGGAGGQLGALVVALQCAFAEMVAVESGNAPAGRGVVDLTPVRVALDAAARARDYREFRLGAQGDPTELLRFLFEEVRGGRCFVVCVDCPFPRDCRALTSITALRLRALDRHLDPIAAYPAGSLPPLLVPRSRLPRTTTALSSTACLARSSPRPSCAASAAATRTPSRRAPSACRHTPSTCCAASQTSWAARRSASCSASIARATTRLAMWPRAAAASGRCVSRSTLVPSYAVFLTATAYEP